MSAQRVAVIHNNLGLAFHSKEQVQMAGEHDRKAIAIDDAISGVADECNPSDIAAACAICLSSMSQCARL